MLEVLQDTHSFVSPRELAGQHVRADGRMENIEKNPGIARLASITYDGAEDKECIVYRGTTQCLNHRDMRRMQKREISFLSQRTDNRQHYQG